MKKRIFNILVSSMLVHSAFAQMENIQVSNNTTINKMYVGLRSAMLIPNDSLVVTPQASFRVGVLLTQIVNKTFSLESQAAIQVSNYSATTAIPSFEVISKLNDKLQVRAGVLVTPTTTVRPNPITWQSQVETYAQARIIGSRPGAMLRYIFNENLFVAYGLHHHNGTWANHVRVDFKQVRVAGYMQTDNHYFVSAKMTSKRIDAVANYSSIQNEIAESFFYNFNERYTVYTDVNYRFDTEASEVFRLGMRSYYKSTNLPIKGFFAVEYDFSSQLTSLQFFIHLI